MIIVIKNEGAIATKSVSNYSFVGKKIGTTISFEGESYKITGACTNDGFFLVKGVDSSGITSRMVKPKSNKNKAPRYRQTVYGRIINNKVSTVNLVKSKKLI